MVIGGALRSLDLLRLAVIRSDDVIFVADRIDAATRRVIDHFAVEHRHRAAVGSDLEGAAAVLVAMGDKRLENRIVRDARGRGVPVHVADRQLVSDFGLLELFAAGPADLDRR